MERVVRFVNERFKNSGNSKDVQNQKEELIASLHDKIHDAMSSGKTEDEAFTTAVASLDGLEELTEALDGRHKNVLINKLNFHHALAVFAIIAIELLLIGFFYLTGPMTKWVYATYAMMAGLGCGVFVTAINPIINAILFIKEPGKVKHAGFDFRKYFVAAIIGWLAISLGLAIINIAILPLMDAKIIWFIWPMVGISNWPVALIIYNILYKNKRYEAK